MTLTLSQHISSEPFLPRDNGIQYINMGNGELHTVTSYSNGVQTYWTRENADGSLTSLSVLPDGLIVLPLHFPTLPVSEGEIAVDFFQDSGNFVINYRGTTGSNKNYQIWLEGVPYEVIPDLALPDGITYETGPNSNGGFNHLFTGSINGFSNASISGSAPTPAGTSVAPQIFCDAF